MDLLNEHIPYYLHSMFDMIGEENFLKICKMYRESSIYIIYLLITTIFIRNSLIIDYSFYCISNFILVQKQ